MIKDYDCTIEYHPGKANVVADALSRKSRLPKSFLCSARVLLIRELQNSGVVIVADNTGGLFAQFQVKSSLRTDIIKKQLEDDKLQKLLGRSKKGQEAEFERRSDGAIIK